MRVTVVPLAQLPGSLVTSWPMRLQNAALGSGVHPHAFAFPPPPHAGRTLLRLRDVSFGYEDGPDILTHARVEIENGAKLAIVGANGAGKTTLLRVLAGQLAPRGGEREQPPHTKVGYFAQHAAETLDGQATILGALEEIADRKAHV